jgi:hypothetical protein
VGAFQRTITDDKVRNHTMITNIFALLPECNRVQQPNVEIPGFALAAAAAAAVALSGQEQDDSDGGEMIV